MIKLMIGVEEGRRSIVESVVLTTVMTTTNNWWQIEKAEEDKDSKGLMGSTTSPANASAHHGVGQWREAEPS